MQPISANLRGYLREEWKRKVVISTSLAALQSSEPFAVVSKESFFPAKHYEQGIVQDTGLQEKYPALCWDEVCLRGTLILSTHAEGRGGVSGIPVAPRKP